MFAACSRDSRLLCIPVPKVVALANRRGKYVKSTASMQAHVHNITHPLNQLTNLHMLAEQVAGFDVVLSDGQSRFSLPMLYLSFPEDQPASHLLSCGCASCLGAGSSMLVARARIAAAAPSIVLVLGCHIKAVGRTTRNSSKKQHLTE